MKTLKILSVITLPLLMACGENSSEGNTPPESLESDGLIMVTNAQFKRGNMQIGGLQEVGFEEGIHANGMLDVPPENKATVSAYFGGYVKNIALLQGQKIAQGQTLFTLENPEYVQVQQDYLETKSQLTYLKADFERQEDLASDNVSSKKIRMKAESDYRVTLARHEALKKKLFLMNMNPNSISESNLSSTIAVKAPISGYITSVSATKGMFLNPSDVALTIINTDHMHAELTIFEKDLQAVKIGQPVYLNVQNGMDRLAGEVFLINKAIDPVNRSVKVHCHFKDESDTKSLTTGMFVEATIATSGQTARSLPASAVVTVEDKSYILVETKRTKEAIYFDKIKVKIGKRGGDRVEILSDEPWTKESKVLLKGSFNLIQE